MQPSVVNASEYGKLDQGIYLHKNNLLVNERVQFERPVSTESFVWNLPQGSKKVQVTIGEQRVSPQLVQATGLPNMLQVHILGPTHVFTHISFSYVLPISEISISKVNHSLSIPLITKLTVPLREFESKILLPAHWHQDNESIRLFTSNNIGSKFLKATMHEPIQISILGVATNVDSAVFIPLEKLLPSGSNTPASKLSQVDWVMVVSGLGVLPISAVVVLVSIALRAWWQDRRLTQRGARMVPPEGVDIGQVGLLIEKRITHRVLLAIIVDLAVRNYIFILERKGKYILALQKPDDGTLTLWEKCVLQHFFEKQNAIPLNDAMNRTRKQFYNSAIAAAYAALNQSMTERELFVENPQMVIYRYKIVGLFFYYTSLPLLFYFMISNPSYELTLPAISGLVTALLLLHFAYVAPRRTDRGSALLGQVAAFRNYLCDPTPLSTRDSGGHLFSRYLPLAIILNCEEKWLYRFRKQAILSQNWFTSDTNARIEDISASFITDLDGVARSLELVHGPGNE